MEQKHMEQKQSEMEHRPGNVSEKGDSTGKKSFKALKNPQPLLKTIILGITFIHSLSMNKPARMMPNIKSRFKPMTNQL